MIRGGQLKTQENITKTLASGFAPAGPVRLLGWGPRDPPLQATIGDMAQ